MVTFRERTLELMDILGISLTTSSGEVKDNSTLLSEMVEKAVMLKEMYKLKPCPFCGGEAVLHVDDGVCVFCKKCKCRTEGLRDGFGRGGYAGSAVKTVIDKWNRRTDDLTEK